MGIFKKEERLETRTISGQELIQVLGYYARRMRQAIDMNTYTAETAAMVEYHGQPYEVGLKYHTRQARKEGQIGFDARYASFYIGKYIIHWENLCNMHVWMAVGLQILQAELKCFRKC